MMFKRTLLSLGLGMYGSLAMAQQIADYEVTITNITGGQTFTPQLVITHEPAMRLFKLGDPASEELEILAEGGDTAPLTDAVSSFATDVQTIGGLLGPGETTSIVVSGDSGGDFLSVVSMLIPTNDTFVALNRVRLPAQGAIARLVQAYDAGTEFNDQSCANIPGPRCGGEGYSGTPTEGDEGFVHLGSGFHELGTEDESGAEVLGPQVYDWGNSVALIRVQRLN